MGQLKSRHSQRRNQVPAILATTLATLVAAGAGAAPSASPDERPERAGPRSAAELESFLDAFMDEQMEELHIPGAVFAFVQDGALLFSKGWGAADLATKTPASPARTIWHLASVSKVFTTTAAMQLVERGLLDLDGDVNDYLRTVRVRPAFGQPVRVRHLMTHTAGFEDKVLGIAARTRDDLSLRRFLERYQPERVFAPGDQVLYSNYGSCLLGQIIEDVSGVPYAQYMEQNILKPLGMNDSSFEMPLELHARLATGYLTEDGEATEVPEFYVNMTPSSTLVSTANDVARFMAAHLGFGDLNGVRILRAETARHMHSRLFAQHPQVDGNAHGFWEHRVNGRRTLEHGGVWFGFDSLMSLIPEEGAGWVLIHTGGDVRLRTRLSERFMDRFYPPDHRVAPPDPVAAGVDVSRYAGTYMWNRYVHASFEKALSLMDNWLLRIDGNDDGSITVHYPDELMPPQRFVQVGKDLFQRADGDGFLAFRSNGEGEAPLLFARVFDLPIAAERVPPYLRPAFQRHLAMGSYGVLLSVLLLVPIAWWWRRRRGIALTGVARWTDRIAMGVSAVHLAFLIGMVVVLGPPMFIEPVFGRPNGIEVVLSLPLIALPGTVALVALVGVKWIIDRNSSMARRLYFSAVAAASVGCALFLSHFNMLGP